MTKEQRSFSLFGEILDWMLTPLLILWPISLALTWLVAQTIANKPFDRALEYNAQALARLVTIQNDEAHFELPSSAGELLRSDDVDQIHYQVLGLQGELLAGEAALPAPKNDLKQGTLQVVLRDDMLLGQSVRVASIWVPTNNPRKHDVLVQVAQTKTKRAQLAADIIKGVMLPQFAILPLAVLLIWLALTRGIAPLHALEMRIRSRSTDDLSPLEGRTPQEVAPLVNAVNDLLSRLQTAIVQQRHFLANAAHQLKTPLAGLQMQADLAQHQSENVQELKQSLAQIELSAIRATHTVNQLLALARIEGANTQSIRKTTCNLVLLTQQCIQDFVLQAHQKKISLAYEGLSIDESSQSLIEGHEFLLKEMLKNLLDNAIKYTAICTDKRDKLIILRITRRSLSERDHINQILAQNLPIHEFNSLSESSTFTILEIEDNGCGINNEEKKLVLKPFYRVLGTHTEGSGLGLTIVQEIANQHDAHIIITDARFNQPSSGAKICVLFK